MSNAASTHLRNTGSATPELVKHGIQRVPWNREMTLRFQESMRDLMAGYPFLASLASSDSVRYHAVRTDLFPIAATDGVGIYFNVNPPSAWFDQKKFTADHRVFAHAHEVLHVVREDVLWKITHSNFGYVPVPRTPDTPDGRLPFVNEVWGLSTDAIINATLVKDRVGKPIDGVFFHKDIKPDTSTGEAYAIIYRETNGGQNLGKTGNGQGGSDPLGHDQQGPGSMGDPYGDDSAESSQPQDQGEAMRSLQASAAERKVAVARAKSAARQAGVGTSNAEQMVEASNPPAIDWRSYFQGWMARAAGNSAWDFRRPARPPIVRELMGDEPFFAPSRGGHGLNHMVLCGDTSGSIGPDEHRATLGTIAGMVRELNPRFVTIIWCDSAIQRVDTFRGTPTEDEIMDTYRHVPIPDGGGTSFIPPFQLIEQIMVGGCSQVPNEDAIPDLLDAGKPDGLCYFTDLYGQAPAEAPPYPVLWACTTQQPAPWGEWVHVDPQELLA